MLARYGDLDSGKVSKVRLLLAQLGIAYHRVNTTQNRGEPAITQEMPAHLGALVHRVELEKVSTCAEPNLHTTTDKPATASLPV